MIPTVAKTASDTIQHPFIIHDKNSQQTKNINNSRKPKKGIHQTAKANFKINDEVSL